MLYCKYGQMESNSRGNYMNCPKNCGCETEKPIDKAGELFHWVVGFGICACLGVAVYSGTLINYVKGLLR